MTQQEEPRAAVLEMTERVQTAITAGEWAQALELETQRRELLARCLDEQRGAGLENLVATLTDLQNTHNRLIGELFHHRRRLVREATTVRTGRRAVRAYGEHEQPAAP